MALGPPSSEFLLGAPHSPTWLVGGLARVLHPATCTSFPERATHAPTLSWATLGGVGSTGAIRGGAVTDLEARPSLQGAALRAQGSRVMWVPVSSRQQVKEADPVS